MLAVRWRRQGRIRMAGLEAVALLLLLCHFVLDTAGCGVVRNLEKFGIE